MNFLIDAQLPPALSRWLAVLGHSGMHVEDFGLREAPDEQIWEYALEQGLVILTKDDDFAQRSLMCRHAPTPVIVWLRIGNATKPELKAWIELRLPGIVQLVDEGSRLVEVI